MIFILLCSFAADEVGFTTSIKTAYNYYCKQVKNLGLNKITFKNFKNKVNECKNSSIYQREKDLHFISSNELSDIDYEIGLFAMRIVSDERF